MTQIFANSKWSESPTCYWSASYEYRRNGGDMQYKFQFRVWVAYASSWFYDALNVKICLDNNIYSVCKVKDYDQTESGWNYVVETDWLTVPKKYNGTTSVELTLYDTSANKSKQTISSTLVVDACSSVFNKLGNFDVDQPFEIGITKYDTSLTDVLEISVRDTIVLTLPNIGTKEVITFTAAQKQQIYSLMHDTNEAQFVFSLTSKSGGASVGGQTGYAVGYISNANPILTEREFYFYDDNDAVVNVTSNNQAIVQNYSQVIVNVPRATAQKGATIEWFFVTIGSISKVAYASGEYNFGLVNDEGEVVVSVSAVDSRGNQTDIQTTASSVRYTPPIVTATIGRKNNYEDETHLTASVQFSHIGNNDVRITYERAILGGEYEDAVAIFNDVENVISCDKASAFTFRITATDSFGVSTSKEFVLAKGEFPLFIDTKRNAVGINAFPRNGEAMRVAGGVAFFENGIVIQSSTSGSTKRFLLSIGDDGALSVTEYKD